jgi:hypothetical protein
MASRISLSLGDFRTEATLFDALAPATIAAFLSALPMRDRSIPVRWSGNAWRTEKDYALLPTGSRVENKAERLSVGDIIFFPPVKIGIAYGPAQWLNPFMSPVDVSLIGKLDRKLEEFAALCGLIPYRGPLPVEIQRLA